MTSTPRIHVLLAAYNGALWINQQISSILAQVSVEITLTVSVDKSTDGTESLIDDWIAADHRVRKLPHGRRFGGAAANFFRLLDEASLDNYSHISLADQDDVWLPDKLARACTLMMTQQADAYSSNVWTWGEDGRMRILNKAQSQKKWDHLFSSAGAGCTYVFSKEVAEAFRFWQSERDLAYFDFHDWLLYAWARENGYCWVIDSQATMLYRQHDHNQMGANQGLAALKRRLRSLCDSWYLTQALRTHAILDVGGSPLAWATRRPRHRARILGESLQLRRSAANSGIVAFMLCLGLGLPEDTGQ